MTPTPTTGGSSALTCAWGLYRTFAATARRQKSTLQWWRLTVLVATLVGTALATLSLESRGWDVPWLFRLFGGLSALAIGLAAFFGREILKPERERHWVQARSAAESFKSEVYLYVTRTCPYDGEDPQGLLLNTVRALEQKAAGFPTETLDEEQMTEGIPEDPLSPDEYVEKRVEDQVLRYYTPTANAHIESSNRWNSGRWALGTAAVVLGALSAFGCSTDTGGWIALVSTATTALVAHLSAERHNYLALSYQSTARRLNWLLARWNESGKTKEDRTDFILGCEEAISIENSAWLAEWSKERT